MSFMLVSSLSLPKKKIIQLFASMNAMQGWWSQPPGRGAFNDPGGGGREVAQAFVISLIFRSVSFLRTHLMKSGGGGGKEKKRRSILDDVVVGKM